MRRESLDESLKGQMEGMEGKIRVRGRARWRAWRVRYGLGLGPNGGHGG